jgi:phosphomannomutase
VDEILNTKASIGGEGNGGVIFPVVHPCRDSFTAMGLTLEHMAATGRTISQLRENIPFYFMLKDKIPGSPEEAHRIIRKLRKKYAKTEDLSTLDGLKINFTEYWIHIRPSNTEPIIRILVEARSEQIAEEVMSRFKQEITGL